MFSWPHALKKACRMAPDEKQDLAAEEFSCWAKWEQLETQEEFNPRLPVWYIAVDPGQVGLLYVYASICIYFSRLRKLGKFKF